MSKIRLGALYPLVTGVAFLLVGVVFIVFLNHTMKQNALQEAEEKAEIILHRNISTHIYFSHDLKPEVFSLTDSFRDKEYFHPSWMSSTFAVREIEKNFQKLGGQDYYYKECAIDARSPENEADSYESAFIRELNEKPELDKRTEIRQLGGRPFLVVIHRGEVMEKSCLRCHSSFENAPSGLVEIYGKERSFNRYVDEVVSAISLRIPLDVPYAAADNLSKKLSGYLVALLVFLNIFITWFTKRVIFQPLDRIHDKATLIISDPAHLHLGEKIELPFGTELYQLTSSFNTLSSKLRQNMDLLEERVRERTSDLGEANEKLKELDHLKSMFIASMSHELRTPLNSILGFSAIILDGLSGDITKQQRDQLERVHKSARHLLAMVSDIIDISKIEAGKVETVPENFYLHELTAEAIDIVKPSIDEKGLVLDVNVPSDIQMYNDSKRLLQALLNLLSNGVKFTESGSLRIMAEKSDTMVVISLSDTGIGISEEHIPQVFQAFERIESHLKIKAGGTGLGLYLTQKLVTEILHGNIEVESEVGKGSTFRIIIPQSLDLNSKHIEQEVVK